VMHVTQDDSVVQRMVDAGYLTPEEALTHPKKNQLLAAMGAEGGVEPNTIERHMAVEDGDAFLLCPDGWWEHFDKRAHETAFADPKCANSARFRAAPTPGISSSGVTETALARFARCAPFAQRCASSRSR